MESEKNGVGRGNFNLGNETGFATRFTKGKSGNPGGRPGQAPYAEATRAVALLTVRDLKIKPSDPIPLAVARRLASEAVAGRVQAAIELANRAEGTSPKRAEVLPKQDIKIRVVYDDPANDPPEGPQIEVIGKPSLGSDSTKE